MDDDDQLRPTRGGATPFAAVRGVLGIAAGLALIALVFAIGGGRLPGGRWLAIHLFTLGPLTLLVVAFSGQLGAGFVQARPQSPRVALLAVGAGILWLAVPAAQSGRLVATERAAVGVGATVVTAGVMASWVRLRRLRKGAPAARWAWIVRIYERAHGAYAHGALLGALLGAGVFSGRWYLAAQRAHLHVMIVGFAGITLVATLVVFGPALLRGRMAPDVATRAQAALRWAVVGVTVASAGLVLSALNGVAGTIARVVAAGGLAAFARAATIVGLAVVWTARNRSAGARGRVIGSHVAAVAVLLVVAAWADVVIVALGAWTWLDALGGLALVGVLANATAAVVTFAGAQVLGADVTQRRLRGERLDALHPWTALATTIGVAAIVAAQAPIATGADWHDVVGRLGVGLLSVAAALLAGLTASSRPVRAADSLVAEQAVGEVGQDAVGAVGEAHDGL